MTDQYLLVHECAAVAEDGEMIIRRLYDHARRGCDWKLYRAVRR